MLWTSDVFSRSAKLSYEAYPALQTLYVGYRTIPITPSDRSQNALKMSGRKRWDAFDNSKGPQAIATLRDVGSAGQEGHKCLHVLRMFLVRQVDSPKVVLRLHRYDAGLLLIGSNLPNPRDSELRFFRATLQSYDHSGLQLGSEATEACPRYG